MSYYVGHEEPWPGDEILAVLEMIKEKILEANYISGDQKMVLIEIIDDLADEYR